MKLRLVKFLVILVLLVLGIWLVTVQFRGGISFEVFSRSPAKADTASTNFPLSPGSYWIYQGTTKWTKSDRAVAQKNLTWKMEVTEAIERGHVTAFVLKGNPYDLVDYEDGRARGNYAIVRVESGKFYLLRGQERSQEAIKRLKDEQDPLVGLVTEEDLFLYFPLSKGKRFGTTEQITRQNTNYQWYVEKESKIDIKDIKGIGVLPGVTQYELAFRTSPDMTIIDLVPNVGITRFVFAHHGSTAETDVKLIEYSAGKP